MNEQTKLINSTVLKTPPQTNKQKSIICINFNNRCDLRNEISFELNRLYMAESIVYSLQKAF